MTTPTEKYRDEVLRELEKEWRNLYNEYPFSAVGISIAIDRIKKIPLPAEPSEPECRGSLGGKHVFLPTGGKCQGCGCNPDGTPSPGGPKPPAQAVEEMPDDMKTIPDGYGHVIAGKSGPDFNADRICALEKTLRDLVVALYGDYGAKFTSDKKDLFMDLARKIERGESDG